MLYLNRITRRIGFILNSFRRDTDFQARKGIALKQKIAENKKIYGKGIEKTDLYKTYYCTMSYKNKIKKFRLKFRFKMLKRATFLSLPHVLTIMEMNADKYKNNELNGLSKEEKEIAKEHYEVLTEMFGESYNEFIENF